MRNLISVAALIAAALAGTAASATDMHYRYDNAGHANTQSYSFTVTNTGAVTIYTMPSTGYYESTLGVKVNGQTILNGILPLGSSSPDFRPTVLGNFNAGDEIEFFLNVYDRDAAGTYLGTYYSDVADNADGLNHLFAGLYPGEPWIGVPGGLFFGFEDTTTGDNRGDNNYNDYTFVGANLTLGAPIPHLPPVTGGDDATLPAVPEPASWAMMVAGFGLAGAAMRRRRSAVAFG
jgi:hypothetical protein